MSLLHDLDLPVVQAPMAGVSGVELAIAVARAGGLGSLPCAMLKPGEIREAVDRYRQKVDGPINLNFFCHETIEPDDMALSRWHDRLTGYYRELGIHDDRSKGGGGRRPFDADMATLIETLRPGAVSFHFGLPEEHLLDRVLATGAFVMSSATTLDEARWLAESGVDAVIAQGIEAGGHRATFLLAAVEAQPSTLELVRQCTSELDLPIIAAGGISTPDAARAAIDAGASGVQSGTAYLLCPECNTTAVHRQVLQTDAAGETAVTNVFSGRPARGIMNRLMREIGPICADAPPFPHAAAAIAPLRAAAEKQASSDFTPLWCGTDVSGCEEISAAEMTRRLGNV